MTIGHLIPLTELERDALGEVSNIAMARAANSLRQMVEHEVLLSVPAVEILSQDQAAQTRGESGQPEPRGGSPGLQRSLRGPRASDLSRG